VRQLGEERCRVGGRGKISRRLCPSRDGLGYAGDSARTPDSRSECPPAVQVLEATMLVAVNDQSPDFHILLFEDCPALVILMMASAAPRYLVNGEIPGGGCARRRGPSRGGRTKRAAAPACLRFASGDCSRGRSSLHRVHWGDSLHRSYRRSYWSILCCRLLETAIVRGSRFVCRFKLLLRDGWFGPMPICLPVFSIRNAC